MVASDNLRASLRDATTRAHDLLDNSMRAAAGWQTRADYARFLKLQYTARLPIEGWLARHAEPSDLPPPQCPLIAQDLLELGERVPLCLTSFAAASVDEITQSDVLGTAWVLAGSSLGNRAIHAEVRRIAKAAGETDWPARFLANDDMLQFWRALRPRIERPADAQEMERATLAAAAVFEHFLPLAEEGDPSPL